MPNRPPLPMARMLRVCCHPAPWLCSHRVSGLPVRWSITTLMRLAK